MRMARITHGILLAALVAAVPAVLAAQDVTTFDSAGVLLGNDVAEASAALKGRGFDVSQMVASFPVAEDTPFVQALTAQKEDDVTRETVVVRFDEPPSAAHSFLVWRSIAFKQGKAPTLESYRAAVREKAGNETYWHDEGGSVVEQYVQWSKSGKKRGGLFRMLDSLPSSYPNACVVGLGVHSPDEAVRAKVRSPEYEKMGGNGPPPVAGVIVPQERCASGLIVRYFVPSRATGLVARLEILLVDQARSESMVGKRDAFLEQRRLAQVEAARKASGKPVL